MLSLKPVCSESSHKACVRFLTCLPAASEVSSILESLISGSSLGGNIGETGESSPSIHDLDRGEGTLTMLNVRAVSDPQASWFALFWIAL